MTDTDRMAKRLEAAERALSEIRGLTSHDLTLTARSVSSVLETYAATIAKLEPSPIDLLKEWLDTYKTTRLTEERDWRLKFSSRVEACLRREESKGAKP